MTSKRVFIVGYPLSVISYNFHRHSKFFEEHAFIHRQYYEGEYVNIDPTFNVIEHNLPTQAGVSGAPIMARNEGNTKEVIIIGIHMHGAKIREIPNMGLMFTKEIVETIERFVRENEENYRNSDDDCAIDSKE
jgi:V8-like Glu-specific endopeptidase